MSCSAWHQQVNIASRSRVGSAFAPIVLVLLLLYMPAQVDAAPLREGPPEQPTPVKIGIKLQQITNVDQRAENFSVGATLMMRWHDPALAYSPDSDPCRCRFKTLKESNFDQLIMEKGRKWPEFTIYNQQGNRFSQNRLFGIFPDGDVLYFERFTTTLQAPDFNFRRYPFDRQQFFIHVDSVYPKDFYVFTDLEGFSEVGARLGQEEWKVQRFDTLVSSVTASTRGATSRFSFRVEAQRHRTYYIFRILLPICIILVVAWVTFFVRDYGRRIDLSNGVLLLFVAFNFTISNDLPRLGYLTFLDTIIFSAFIVTSLVVIINVYLQRIESADRRESAHRLDRYVRWGYPATWLVLVLFLVSVFHWL